MRNPLRCVWCDEIHWGMVAPGLSVLSFFVALVALALLLLLEALA